MLTRVLFVCSGNICRSPTAEAVMRHLVNEAGLGDEIEVDGAGTGAWHVGEPPDDRASAAAARRGIALTGTARQIEPDDFETCDLVLSVDEDNLRRLRRIAPPGSRAEVRKLAAEDIADPYYGGPDGFENVLDAITAACETLLAEIR